MFQLACMLPDEVIVPLIRNTLPSDYMSNSSKTLKSFVDQMMNPGTRCADIYIADRLSWRDLPQDNVRAPSVNSNQAGVTDHDQ